MPQSVTAIPGRLHQIVEGYPFVSITVNDINLRPLVGLVVERESLTPRAPGS